MPVKPTYKELEKKVKKLEKDSKLLKKLKAQLWETNEKFTAVFNNVNDAILYVGPDGTIIDMNDRTVELFGHKRKELAGKNIFNLDILSHEDMRTAWKGFEDVRTGKSPPPDEFRAFRKDRSVAVVKVNTSIIKKGKKIKGFLTFVRDLTEKKKAEEELRASEGRFKTIFETANDVIVMSDNRGGVIDINEKCYDVFGYKRKELVGKNFGEVGIFLPDDITQLFKRIDSFEDDRPINMEEFEIRRKDNKRVVVEVNSTILKKGKKLQGFISIIRDITRRKHAEEVLKMHREQLEDLVKERTVNLEEANTALRVLLKRREEDKSELEDKVLFSVKELIDPYLLKLKQGRLRDRQKAYLDILESNLQDITSPYSHKLTSRYLNLTPTEIQIAELVKKGKTSKEIADLLNSSQRAIEFHRSNLRDKLGLKNQKVNLRSHLLSLV